MTAPVVVRRDPVEGEDGAVPARVLVVEDDDRIRAALRLALLEEQYEVLEASGAEEALAVHAAQQPDVLLVDLMLGGMDGFELLRRVRQHSDVPAIVVSARGDTHDVVAALEAGADDYVVKPVVMKELTARIRAVRRRAVERPAPGDASPADVLVLAPGSDGRPCLEFSARAGWLKRDGQEVALTATEFKLLAVLAAHLGQVLSRPQLLQLVWDYDHLGDDRLVDVTVRRLRVKLEPDPSEPTHLVTLRGRGYRLQAAP